MAMYKRERPVFTLPARSVPGDGPDAYSRMRRANAAYEIASGESTDGSDCSSGTSEILGEIVDLLLEVRNMCGRIETRMRDPAAAGETIGFGRGPETVGEGRPRPGGKRVAKRICPKPQGTGSPAAETGKSEADLPAEGSGTDRGTGNG